MKTYATKEMMVEVVEEIKCNRCGKMIPTDESEGYFHGEQLWGYFSNKDGRHDSFDLCEGCYDLFVESFALPVFTQEE
ncbi:MAG: hypothetical protein R3Y53_10830 [Bacillota bacterium]